LSINGTTTFNVLRNIGVVRSSGTELTFDARVLDAQALSWGVGANVSHRADNILTRLNAGETAVQASNAGAATLIRFVEGYPLFGLWGYPVLSYADLNGDHVLQQSEIRFADSAAYLGQGDPKYVASFHTDAAVLNGRLSAHASFTLQTGQAQVNQSTAFDLLPNAPGATLATQTLLFSPVTQSTTLASTGKIQTVSTFRFNDLSINYVLPKGVAGLFRASNATVALQGSNLGLHTNYRGKDPNVNAYPTGNITADSGQLPLTRMWRLQFTVGN
jgi:hypothetical protein